MAESPVLGPPTAIYTHDDGRFSVEFGWETAPDALWLKAIGDLLRRSGRTSVDPGPDRLTITFSPQDAEVDLDDLGVLMEDAERAYRNELAQREEALRYVREALEQRFGAGTDLPVRER